MTSLREQAEVVQSVKPELGEMIAKMEATTKNKVFSLIANNILTPEIALSAWMEMYSYKRLSSRIDEMAAYKEK